MSYSIISNEKACFFCGSQKGLQRHHIYAGSRRAASEKYGLWVWLCLEHHTGSNYSVHTCKRLNDYLQERGQREFEKQIGTREDFIKIFGRSFIW